MKSTALTALAASLAPASAYLITEIGVNCRAGPGTSYAIKKSYSKGEDVTITCQTSGTDIFGTSIWDKTQDGCYVTDYYVQTGSSGYVTEKCDGSLACDAPKSNQATVDLIAEFEGFVPDIYIDATGHPTVGYGHLCYDSTCSSVKYPIPLSDADGKKLLADDMTIFEQCITSLFNPTPTVILNRNQYGALVSWSFNVGCPAAETSTLASRLKAGEDVNTVLAEELPRWKYGGGEVLPGLVRRRDAEVALARETTGEGALPVSC